MSKRPLQNGPWLDILHQRSFISQHLCYYLWSLMKVSCWYVTCCYGDHKVWHMTFFLGYELSRDLVEYNSYKYYLTKFTFRSEEEWPGGVIYTHYTFILSKFKTRNRKNLSNLNTWAENIKLWKSTVIVDILDLFWLPEITRYKVFK